MPIPNPIIIEDYRGYAIRKYTKIQIRVNVKEAKKIIDAKLDHDMSARDAIINNVILCKSCIENSILPVKRY